MTNFEITLLATGAAFFVVMFWTLYRDKKQHDAKKREREERWMRR